MCLWFPETQVGYSNREKFFQMRNRDFDGSQDPCVALSLLDYNLSNVWIWARTPHPIIGLVYDMHHVSCLMHDVWHITIDRDLVGLLEVVCMDMDGAAELPSRRFIRIRTVLHQCHCCENTRLGKLRSIASKWSGKVKLPRQLLIPLERMRSVWQELQCCAWLPSSESWRQLRGRPRSLLHIAYSPLEYEQALSCGPS